MKTNLKVIVIMFALTMFVSSCGIIQFVPKATATEVPTQTALPTYTPMPTYTPYPTSTARIIIETQPLPPTSAPENFGPSGTIPLYMPDGIELYYDCSQGDLPTGATRAECYTLDGKGLGLIYLDSRDNVIGIGASWYTADNLAYTGGTFLGWAGISNGWDGDDIVGAIKAIKSPDMWYTYNSIKAKITLEDGKTTLVLKPAY